MTSKKVLIPLDGSDSSRQILPHVRRFLDPAEHTLILLRVAPPPQGLIGGRAQPASADWPQLMYRSHQDAEFARHPIYASQMRDSFIANLEYELRPDVLRFQEAGYRVSIAVRFGDAAQEILDFIEDETIDLVALTTHGRTGLRRLIFGSVAERVLNNVSVPVMVLRPTEQVTVTPAGHAAVREKGD